MGTTKIFSFPYTEFEDISELSSDDRELIQSARDSSVNAYAPYSNFRVGAAIRLKSGLIVRGSNVENSAFPSGICAEKTAISYAVTNYPHDNPVAIAIAAYYKDSFTEDPITPCGSCRQVLAEEEIRINGKIKMILSGKQKTIITDSISNLLPIQFNQKFLNSDLH
jgi:cytidine deaminase